MLHVSSMQRLVSLAAVLAVLALDVRPCAADSFLSDFVEDERPVEVPNPYRYAWSDARMQSRIGVGVTLGGGIGGFTDGLIRSTISESVGGTWNLRVAIGTHIPIGGELTYTGSAAKLVTLGDDYGGALVGTGFEAALRYTILPLASGTPYVFAGAGWQRYDVVDAQLGLADTGIRDTDSVAVFPLGAGIAYRDATGWVGDLRATFRPTTTSTLMTQANGDNIRLDTWEASAAIGYEF